jgi:hypothetical protein
MRMGRSISLIDRRLLSVGFLLKGEKASQASLKWSVIVSGIMLGLGGFRRGRAGAVENYDDDDQCK